jgi:hypothetical protein
MIDETGAWLTWALEQGIELPRIPRRSVEDGGFGSLLTRPGARAAVDRWWYMALDQVSRISRR